MAVVDLRVLQGSRPDADLRSFCRSVYWPWLAKSGHADYSIAKAKDNLSKSGREAVAGEDVAITRHGKVVAYLRPAVERAHAAARRTNWSQQLVARAKSRPRLERARGRHHSPHARRLSSIVYLDASVLVSLLSPSTPIRRRPDGWYSGLSRAGHRQRPGQSRGLRCHFAGLSGRRFSRGAVDKALLDFDALRANCDRPEPRRADFSLADQSRPRFLDQARGSRRAASGEREERRRRAGDARHPTCRSGAGARVEVAELE